MVKGNMQMMNDHVPDGGNIGKECLDGKSALRAGIPLSRLTHGTLWLERVGRQSVPELKLRGLKLSR